MATILYVGPFSGTAADRGRALEDLGHEVVRLRGGIPTDWRYQLYRVSRFLDGPFDVQGMNRALLRRLRHRRFDLLWIDKGIDLRLSTLRFVREEWPELPVVHYCPDDYRLLVEESVEFADLIPHFDVMVTTKSYNVAELADWCARDVVFVDNAYQPEVHRPVELDDQDAARFCCEVGFVGFFERDRAEQIYSAAVAGIPVTVRGPGWERFEKRHANLIVEDRFLDAEEYVKAVNGAKINLGFLRKQARDRQTTRSIEIPACGAFMLAERTEEHMDLFEEGVEAEFFGDTSEMIRKCRFYLDHDEERERISRAGLERCRRDRYDNAGRLARVMEHLESRGLVRAPAT